MTTTTRTTIDTITDTITDAQIVALRDEAAKAGDSKQVAVCERALAGVKRDRRECARVIAAAKAMED